MAVELTHSSLLSGHQLEWFAGCAAVLLLALALGAVAARLSWLGVQRRSDVPEYWENAGKCVRRARRHEFFDDAFPVSMEYRQVLQELMNKTCSHEEEGFRLVRAVRVESSVLWARYLSKLQAVKAHRGRCEFAGRTPPSILEAWATLEDKGRTSFQTDVEACEAYLWLGTNPETAMGVIHHGVMPQAAASPYGEGWVLCEDMALADQSAQAGQGVYKQVVALLLCRVVLGRQQLLTGPPEASCRGGLAADGEAPVPAGSATSSGTAGRGRAHSASSSSSCGSSSSAAPGLGASSTPVDAEAALEEGRGGPPTDSANAGLLSRLRLLKEGTSGRLRHFVHRRHRPTGEFDSKLVELPEQPRMFVVPDSCQVYPEFAICYERCHVEDVEFGYDPPTYWDHARSLIFGTAYPPYWQNSHSDAPSDFHDMFPAMKFNDVLQRLADDTWKAKWTRDRLGHDGKPIPKGDPNADMPVGIRILRGWRVESAEGWDRYRACEQGIAARRGSCTPLRVQSVDKLPARARRRMNSAVNEAYLWHGTSPVAVLSIAMGGFNVDLAGSNVGAMFGRGAYFAECSSKADEYSRDDKEGYYKGCFAMLLCRVVLGEAQVLLEADYAAHERTGAGRPHDSTIGDRESAVGTYREFVIPSQDQIYPEYALIYERLYRTGPRVR